MIAEPDRQGKVRQGCYKRAVEAWEKTNSCLHFNRDFRINSQPLAACLTPEPTLGGRAWPNFRPANEQWEIPMVLWANTTLGLISFWWLGTRQQSGRSVISISKLPLLSSIDMHRITNEQIARARVIFREFESREFRPANEAWRDEARQDLDRAVLIDLLGLPENIMEPLDLLRRQWCAEPSVHGGKKTAPP